MDIDIATDPNEWDNFLMQQQWSPFLQSWIMGEVYREIGQEPVRLEMRDGTELVAICQAIVVPARRGRHLMVQYGPVLNEKCKMNNEKLKMLIEELKKVAKEKGCSFIRLSPFWPKEHPPKISDALPAPLHLLAEHIWFLDLKGKTEEDILKGMRKTTRNLIRRAQKDGVEVRASDNPIRDLPTFLELHNETRKRHHFTPYTTTFFRAQLKHFAPKKQCTLYLARYQGRILAASIHMHFGKETSYHHGASSFEYSKVPASYLLQWKAIQDALTRGDHIYNFWGIAPQDEKRHPFAGVTLFKTGFGGEPLMLVPCMDIPLSKRYYFTRTFELLRKWKRGF